MTEEKVLHLVESRHPLIEVADPSACISNGVNMIPGKSNLQILTGPNMGGKSTFIRQVATCILLAHIGCFLPCEQAKVPLTDCIIARVGASDPPIRGISTFLAEMLGAACMLKTATDRSFVIMDELGRGTSTKEGFGLAWAIAEYLATDINCLCLFATHFHEMTDMEAELPNVKNLYVSALAEEGKLTMLYKVKEGVVDRSYGIHVAEMLKFPESVLEMARQTGEQLERFQDSKMKA
jgi:DNA mismatch repair protein MSH2